jgi:hypothetical protein
MTLLANALKHLMLDAVDESAAGGMKFGSLHTAYSATGTNEVTGGSPAYARKGLTWNAAASGAKALAATLPTFDVPAGTTVGWLGIWDAVTTGTFLAITPLGGGAKIPFGMDDTTADSFKAGGHGFSNGDTVVFWPGAGTLPTGVSVGTVYFIVNTATNTFQVSATSGGSAINLTGAGEGLVQKIVQETFAAQGTYSVNSGTSIDLGAA